MSLINGDKARDNRRRRSQTKMREKVRALRIALAEKVEPHKFTKPAPHKASASAHPPATSA
jgi:hypothetical protein